jgi:hypothetical protein
MEIQQRPARAEGLRFSIQEHGREVARAYLYLTSLKTISTRGNGSVSWKTSSLTNRCAGGGTRRRLSAMSWKRHAAAGATS